VFAYCKCFLSQSIFLSKFSLYVEYDDDDEKFKKEYLNVIPENKIESCIECAKEEIKRRILLRENVLQRMKLIKEQYHPLHPDVYHFDASRIFEKNTQVDKIGKDVFSMPVFTPFFTEKLLSELKHFKCSKLPQQQPNSMNKHGILLDEIGFQNFIDNLREEFIQPLSRKLFNEPDLVLDSHKAFVVKYALGEDIELSNHFDNAEITLNVALSQNYEDGELVFNTCNPMTGKVTPKFGYEHKFGHGVLHKGSHYHQALPISSGERWNLIIWARSSKLRSKCCPMCKSIPSLNPAPPGTYGDGFLLTSPDEAQYSTCSLN